MIQKEMYQGLINAFPASWLLIKSDLPYKALSVNDTNIKEIYPPINKIVGAIIADIMSALANTFADISAGQLQTLLESGKSKGRNNLLPIRPLKEKVNCLTTSPSHVPNPGYILLSVKKLLSKKKHKKSLLQQTVYLKKIQ